MTTIEFATATTKGRRSYQEDAFVVRTWDAAGAPAQPSDMTLAVLADGMGGHAGGAIASKLVCEHMVAGFQSPRPSLALRLVAGLEAANTAIAERAQAEPALKSMGSTLVACAFSGDGLEWLSVGDSPLWLVRNHEIEQLNEDHSFAPVLEQMVAEGRMTRAAADMDGRRHMLLSAVTGEEMELIDTSRQVLALAPGDVIILASDGVETLSLQDIVDLVDEAVEANVSAGTIARALIDDVDNRRKPHQDNATVIVARVL